ncbi:MAG: hypothetical protein J6U98_05950, partial [Abditibacteriota bacterium]|nr:hypothetical protein [Abditibacteriota bacterium]
AGHIADLDMNWTDVDRELGYVVCWEDAGWSASKFWANANFEGPDFGETVRYLNKNDMKLCVWAMGHHHYGLFAAKQAAWGDFQWRSDGIGFDENMDGVFRNRVETFLNENPRSSFHTCSSGATFALNFEIQRYTDVNYDSDGPGSEYTNAYWSYLCTPDKWFDNLNCWGDYRYDKGLRNLTQLPKWSIDRKLSQSEDLRYLPDLYKYMLRVGLAGRWSYTVHPKVEGDKDFYVGQRISADGKRSLIIPKHICPAGTKIYPAGLNPNDSYLVEFKLSDKKETRTGADLMKNGITLGEQKENELIFLNMPDRPGSGTDKTPPTAPSAVYVKRETNIGCTGTGVYWTAATDNNHISYYEIKRGGKVLGRAAVGTYFFDREPGWDGGEVYAVRTVDGDGNGSPWTTAKGIADEPSEYSALGCVYKSAITQDWGTRTNPYDTYNGWSAETSKDLKTFEPLKWVNNERTSCIDAGGNCLQPGGAEGYFEAEGARVGRGWQSASENVYCVRVWTAPAGGKVRVSGKATKELYHFTKGGDLTVGVLLNDKAIWNSAAKKGTLDGVFHDLWVDIEKGDKLRFVVGKGSSPENDIIAWIPRIVYAVGEKAKADTVRILCGSSEDYKDNLGNVWGKDRYFTGGRVCFGGSKIDALYAKGRKGTDFTYRIPAKPGTYLVRLMFAETQFDRHFARPVTVTVNNKEVMTNVDIAQAARGVGKPYDRLVRYVVPDKEGNIVINFKGGYEPDMLTKEAMVKAVEVVPEHANIVRINCGGELFVDTYGRVWRGDDRKGVYTPTREGAETLVPLSFEGRADFDDSTYKHIEQATPTHLDQDIYRSAAVGKVLEYKIPLASGLYDVCLKFAETSEKTLGKRPMDIYVNGKLTYGDMDPASRAGKTNTAADVRIEDVSPDGHGFINIKIKAKGAKDASLCGIVIE